MTRPIRVEYPGAVYHVTARGNERRRTFRDDEDRRLFLATLAEGVKQSGLRVHGYCLMPNHYHLLVETPRGNLSRAIGWLQTTYTIRFNHRHRRSGHLFQGRFKAQVVEADSYAMTLLRYVHLNPVRPREKTAPVPAHCRRALEEYRWSSHRAYLGREAAPEWLCTQWLCFFGRTRKEGGHQYRRFVAEAFSRAVENPWEHLHFGLALGGEALVAHIREVIKAKPQQEELRWVAREESDEASKSARELAAREVENRRLQVWLRVRLGGERRIDVARAYGYRDGSAVTQLLKRLDVAAQADRTLRARLSALRREHIRRLSSVKS